MAYVPQIKGLRVAELLEEARKHVNIDDYMQEMKDEKLPNRDFVVNVGKRIELFNVHSEHLDPSWTSKNDWTNEKWKRRKIHKEKTCEWRSFQSFRKYSQIQKKYQVRSKLLNSKVHNGRFRQLIRSTVSRRLAREVRHRGQLVEDEGAQRIDMSKDQIIENLKQKVRDFDALRLENDKNSVILAKLFDGGVIDEEGKLIGHLIDEQEM